MPPLESLEGFQLSPQQKRLWLLQQRDGPASWETRLAIKIEGPVDAKRLADAIRATVVRHEILRTNFSRVPGMTLPVQVVTENSIVFEESRSTLGDGTESSMVERLLVNTNSIPIALATGPVVHVTLFVVPPSGGPAPHWLLLRAPTLCLDDASAQQWFTEIVQAYGGLEAGTSPKSETMQYADFSAWQCELLESPDVEPGKDFWRKAATTPEIDRLPFRTEPPGITPHEVERHSWKWTGAIFEKWRAWQSSQKTDGDLFLLGAWQGLLASLSNVPGLAVAVAFDGRKYPELKQALGLYARYAPVLAPIIDTETFGSHLGRLAKAVATVSEWQECFLWETWHNGKPDQAIRIAFRSERSMEPVSSGGCRFELAGRRARQDRTELELIVCEKANALELAIDYDRHKYAAADVQRLAARLDAWIECLLAKPDAALKDFDWLPRAEKEVLLREFAGISVPHPKAESIHSLIELQAAQTPGKTAVICAGAKLTYGELNARANQLAHVLIERGVCPEKCVAICMERSVETIVAILAALKAGGAYVPLDPLYPSERLQFALDEIEASVVITHRVVLEKLPVTRAPILCLEDEAETIGRQNTENPEVAVTANHLAYVIFTSGSTGKPKGVQIEHGNLVHSTLARHSYYPEPVSSYLLVSSFAFDSSVAGIFWTLTTGGTLVLPQEKLHQDPSELIGLLVRHQISHFLCLPSLYALILQQADPAQLAFLRNVIVAGEACPAPLIEKHRALAPKARLHNEYGPTEGTVWSTAATFSEKGGDQVTIGKPIPNARIYLLNPGGKLAPLGVPGEIYIGGPGVARGYAHRPELTAEKFLSNPFEAGGRLYRTGDLGRFTLEGEVLFLGRIDHQVKIRGYRIELGEIENVLLEHPGIREAVVVARELGAEGAGAMPDQKQLAAYLVASDSRMALSEIRAFLKSKLPEYMVPSDFVWLEALPLGPNGKVDRAKLPAPGSVERESETSYVAARTSVEEKVCLIWTDVLKAPRIGMNDNFFEMGGHSLLAIQIISRLREEFQVELPLRALFEAPTVAQLSESVARSATTSVPTSGENDDDSRLLAEIGELSDEEVQKLLEQEKPA